MKTGFIQECENMSPDILNLPSYRVLQVEPPSSRSPGPGERKRSTSPLSHPRPESDSNWGDPCYAYKKKNDTTDREKSWNIVI